MVQMRGRETCRCEEVPFRLNEIVLLGVKERNDFLWIGLEIGIELAFF